MDDFGLLIQIIHTLRGGILECTIPLFEFEDVMVKTNFKQADLERGIRAAKATDLSVSCVQIDKDGTIQIIIGDPIPARNLAKVNDKEINEWDEA